MSLLQKSQKTKKMSEKDLFLGIDTSNYTTSVALCNGSGKVILNLKKLLPVKAGERGLRQSDALFAHTKNLPEIMRGLKAFLDSGYRDHRIVAVGCSATPRDAKGSYMPCFLAGVSAAETVSATVGCEKYSFSHQNGHVMAALYSSGMTSLIDGEMPFAAFHVSGGTTELLLVKPNTDSFSIEQIGGSDDMNAGQAIDRTGVLMGLAFPCGKEMEALCTSVPYKKSRISVKGLKCNLSGLENLAAKLYAETGDKAVTSAFCFDFIADTLTQLSLNLREIYPDIPIVFAGGVMSNKRIAKRLSMLGNVFFSEPEFSADNAAGTALLTRRAYTSDNE